MPARPRTLPSLPGPTRQSSNSALHALPLVLAALLALAATPSPAATEPRRYDPATCSTDAEGKIYLRLTSGVAFAIPADVLKERGTQVRYDPPPVPNPDDPEGCPGNPILTNSVWMQFGSPIYVSPSGFEVIGITICGALAILQDTDGYLLLQDSALRRFASYKQNGNWCETTPAGWDVCYPHGVTERPEHPPQFAAVYVAREDIHPLRSGAPITMECWVPWAAVGHRPCSPHYQPLPGVSLFSRFSEAHIPVESFFEYDRAITQRLESMRVPELDFEPPVPVVYRKEASN